MALTDDLPGPPVLTSNLSNDILEMGRLRNELLEVERNNSNWWIPRMGLDQSLMMEHRLKEYYCAMFYRGFLENLDDGLGRMVEEFSANTRGQVFGAYVQHLVTRINLLKAAIKGASARQPGQNAAAVLHCFHDGSKCGGLPSLRSLFLFTCPIWFGSRGNRIWKRKGTCCKDFWPRSPT